MLRCSCPGSGATGRCCTSTSSGGVTEFRVYREREEGKVTSRVCGVSSPHEAP